MTDPIRCRWEIGPRRCHLAGALVYRERPMCAWHHWLATSSNPKHNRSDFDAWLDEERDLGALDGATLPPPWGGSRSALWAAVIGEAPMPDPDEEAIEATLRVRASRGQTEDAMRLAYAVVDGVVGGTHALQALHESMSRTNTALRDELRRNEERRPQNGPLATTLRRAFDQARAEAGIAAVDPVKPDRPDDL